MYDSSTLSQYTCSVLIYFFLPDQPCSFVQSWMKFYDRSFMRNNHRSSLLPASRERQYWVRNKFDSWMTYSSESFISCIMLDLTTRSLQTFSHVFHIWINIWYWLFISRVICTIITNHIQLICHDRIYWTSFWLSKFFNFEVVLKVIMSQLLPLEKKLSCQLHYS